MNKYAQLVKQIHRPTVSKKKKEELEKLRKSVELGSKPLYRPKSKKHITFTDSEAPKSMQKHRHTKSQAKIDWRKFHNPMVPKEKPKKQGIVIDYLVKQRNRRVEREQELIDEGEKYTNPYYDWKNLIDKTSDEKDYEELIKNKARVIENNALMKRKYAEMKDDFDEEINANDMLIEALQARLSILDRIE